MGLPNSDATALVEHQVKHQVQRLMAGFSVETTPGAAAKIPDYRDTLQEGTVVYVTFLPGADFDDTIAVARRLRAEGLEPVPHFAARSIPHGRFLEEKLTRLAGEAGITRALSIGGALSQPLGAFKDSMQVLETGLFDKLGIREIGVAGHPEGSPDIPDEAIEHALKWKNAFAERTDARVYLVTQFCFEADPIIRWDRHLQAEGNRLPIHIGLPGLASIKALLGHARACGVGPSMRFLQKQARNVTRLLSLSAPDKLLLDLARYRMENPACGIEAVHMYPLGGLKKSADWSYAVAGGDFDLDAKGQGFSLHTPAP